MERQRIRENSGKRYGKILTVSSGLLMFAGVGSFVFAANDDLKVTNLEEENFHVAQQILPSPSESESQEAFSNVEILLSGNEIEEVDLNSALQVLGVDSAQFHLASFMDDQDSLDSRNDRNTQMIVGGVFAIIVALPGTLAGAIHLRRERASNLKSADSALQST